MLNELHALPEGFLDIGVEEVESLLGNPTLIHLDGAIKQPLFVSTLLHGNETTGFFALQRLLKRYQGTELPRALTIFIGNVRATTLQQRHLDGQPDYNRIWPGTSHSECAETDMMRQVTGIMRKHKPFASIDIHNNTGHNPHYACVNNLNPHGLQIASMFNDIMVYFTDPKGVQSMAFSDFCPAVVLECGVSGEADSVDHALEFIDHVLRLEKIPSGKPEDLQLYHTVARVLIPSQFRFGVDETELQLYKAYEDRNFTRLEASTVFAERREDSIAKFVVRNESAEDVVDEFFRIEDGRFILQQDVVLAMYTTNHRAIEQDCLCYFMENLQLT